MKNAKIRKAKDVALALRVNKDLKQELVRRANEDGRTLSNYVVLLLNKAIKVIE